LESETVEAEQIIRNFPEPLKEPILRKVQFSTISRLDSLVDDLYNSLRQDFYPGESAIAKLNDQRVKVVVREKAKFNAITLPNGDVRPAYSKYRVEVVSDPGQELVVDDNQLTRDRKLFTKVILRTFIKHSVSREAWTGAPWIVKPEYAHRYRLETTVPANLRKSAHSGSVDGRQKKGKEVTDSSSKVDADQKKRQKPGSDNLKPSESKPTKPTVKEDLLYPFDEFATKANFKMDPVLSVEDQYLMGSLMETWLFLYVYHEPLLLDPFPFDDFVDVMRLADEETECALLDEIHCALLSLIVDSKDATLRVLLPLEDNKKNWDEDEMEQEEEQEQEQQEDEDEDDEIKGQESNNGEYPKKEDTENGELNDAPDKEEEKEQMVKKDEDEEESETEQNGVEQDQQDEQDDGALDVAPHRASSFVHYQNVDWKERLRKRMFRDGGWQQILIGLLHTVSYVPEWSQTCQDALMELASRERPITLYSARTGYFGLSFAPRIKVLDILCSLLYSSHSIRYYIEKCMEESTKLRKERIDRLREHKTLAEVLKGLEEEKKTILAETTPVGESEETPSSPGGDRKQHHLRKRPRNDAETAMAKQNPGFAKLLKTYETTVARLDEIAVLQKQCEEGLIKLDCQRLRMLGKDRYYNRYWWFESNGMRRPERIDALSKKSGNEQQHVDDAGDDDDADDDDADDDDDDGEPVVYAMGRLWIQGPTDEDHRVYLSKHPVDQKEEMEQFVPDGPIPIEQKKLSEQGWFLESADLWGYYDEPEQIESLLAWLNPYGKRETKLIKELQHAKPWLLGSMNARQKNLKADAESRKEEVDRILEEEFGPEEEIDEDEAEEAVARMKAAAVELNGAASEPELPRRRGRGRPPKRNAMKTPEMMERELQEKRERIRVRKENVAGREQELMAEMAAKIPERVLSWTNGLAEEKLGNSHYEGSQKKRGIKKSKNNN
jgi:hypothetical protein